MTQELGIVATSLAPRHVRTAQRRRAESLRSGPGSGRGSVVHGRGGANAPGHVVECIAGLGQEAEEGVKDMGVHGKQFKIDGDALIAESVRPEQGPRLQAS